MGDLDISRALKARPVGVRLGRESWNCLARRGRSRRGVAGEPEMGFGLEQAGFVSVSRWGARALWLTGMSADPIVGLLTV